MVTFGIPVNSTEVLEMLIIETVMRYVRNHLLEQTSLDLLLTTVVQALYEAQVFMPGEMSLLMIMWQIVQTI